MSKTKSLKGGPARVHGADALPDGGGGRSARLASLGVTLLASPATSWRARMRRPTLDFLAAGLVAMLAVEFLLGTYLAMFVEMPANGAIETLPLDGLVVIILHILIGLALIVLGIRMVLVAVKSKATRGMVLAGIALIGILMAFIGGALFTGNGDEVMSFVMASGTFLALMCAALIFMGASAARAGSGTGAA